MRVVTPVLLLLLSALAGCVDEGPSAVDAGVPDDAVVLKDPDTGSDRLARRLPVVFTDDEPDVFSGSFEGSFDLQQHGYPAGNVQRQAGLDPGNVHTYDITEHVPKGMPVRITAEVEASLERGDLDLWLDIPFEEVWTSDEDTPYGGRSSVSYVLVHTSDDPVSVAVRYDEYDTSASFDYALEVGIWSAPDLLPAGVPVVVPVPRGPSAIELAFPDESPEHVWLWGPDDAVIATAPPADGRWNHTFDTAGDHVLLLPAGPAEANVTLVVPHDGTAAPRPFTFGLLKQAFEQTEPTPFDAGAEAVHEFDLSGVPLQLGVQIDLERFSKDMTTSLEGPGGTLLSVTLEDDLPFYSTSPDGWIGFTFLTPLGDPRLSAGAHTASFSGDPNGAGVLSAWIVTYARA